MTMFEDREKAIERQFVEAQELPFKITARRNKLLGLWAAGEMGLSDDEASRYAASVVAAEATPHDDRIIVQKVFGDLKAHGWRAAETEVVAHLRQYTEQARSELGDAPSPWQRERGS